MSVMYDEYIMEHKSNVLRAYDWLRQNLSMMTSQDIWDLVEWQCTNGHDYSKTSKEEYDAYDRYFYARGGVGRSFKATKDFEYAWLHHIHNNPHHWQHWVLISDESEEGIKILDMPTNYIIEMICDWWSFSWKSQNLMEIFDWYDKHKKYMKLSDSTRTQVEKILVLMKGKLDETLESKKDYIYMDPLRDKE